MRAWIPGLVLLTALGPVLGAEEDSPPVTLKSLASSSQVELNRLYALSPPGDIPSGSGRGRAIFFPGTVAAHPMAALAALVWQGKIFDIKKGVLHNRILGFKAIKAKVFLGPSWYDEKPSIIIDYRETSALLSGIRDEIRLVAPGIYLGRAYLRSGDDAKSFIVNFALDFNPKSSADEDTDSGAPPAPENP